MCMMQRINYSTNKDYKISVTIHKFDNWTSFHFLNIRIRLEYYKRTRYTANLWNISYVGSHLSPNRNCGFSIYPSTNLFQKSTILPNSSTHFAFWHTVRTWEIYFKCILRVYQRGQPSENSSWENAKCHKLNHETHLTTPVCSTLSISSSHAALLYSSMIEAMRILSGYSSFNCLNSFNIVSSGLSLISSMFSHPIISPFADPFAPARSRAYRGVTFITFAASSDT